MSIRTIALTLRPDAAQAAALAHLQRQFNAACNAISVVAWREQEFAQFELHKLVYRDMRDQFGLLAQHVIRAIAVVAHSHKADKTRCHTFHADAPVVLDTPRLYSLRATLATIAMLDGRTLIPLALGGKQWEQLATATKVAEADLIHDDKGRWRLLVSATFPDPPIKEPTDMLGVDLGIVNIAADSDGTLYSGAELIGLRIRHRRLRKRLQMRHTASARKLRRKRRRREARFARNTNHVISKRIVAVAARTGRAIAIEDLGGIRSDRGHGPPGAWSGGRQPAVHSVARCLERARDKLPPVGDSR